MSFLAMIASARGITDLTSAGDLTALLAVNGASTLTTTEGGPVDVPDSISNLFVNSSGAAFLRAGLTVAGVTEVQSAGPADDEAGVTEKLEAAAEGDVSSRTNPLRAEADLSGSFAFLEACFDLANIELLTIRHNSNGSQSLGASSLDGLAPDGDFPADSTDPADLSINDPFLGCLDRRTAPSDLLVGVQVPEMKM